MVICFSFLLHATCVMLRQDPPFHGASQLNVGPSPLEIGRSRNIAARGLIRDNMTANLD